MPAIEPTGSDDTTLARALESPLAAVENYVHGIRIRARSLEFGAVSDESERHLVHGIDRAIDQLMLASAMVTRTSPARSSHPVGGNHKGSNT